MLQIQQPFRAYRAVTGGFDDQKASSMLILLTNYVVVIHIQEHDQAVEHHYNNYRRFIGLAPFC